MVTTVPHNVVVKYRKVYNMDEDQILDQETDQETVTDQLVEDQEQESEEVSDESTDQEEHLNEEEDLSPRQQKRVDQIENQAKEYKFNKILDRIYESKGQPSGEEDKAINYRDVIEAPDEVYDVLERDREYVRNQTATESRKDMQAMEWRTNIKLDLPLIKDRLDKLDPSDAQAIDREYLLFSGFDPKTGRVERSDIGYADFVEARIEQAERLAANMNLRSTKNIAKQAAQTGVRPDGNTRTGIKIQNPGDIANMSAEEFEKNRAAIYKQAGIPYNK